MSLFSSVLSRRLVGVAAHINTTNHILTTTAPWIGAKQSFLQIGLRSKHGMKTNSGAKKRFRLRGSGSIKRGKSGRSHNTGYKQRQRVNRLGSTTGIKETKIENRVRKLLGCFGS